MATLPKFFDELAGDTLIYLLGDLIVTFSHLLKEDKQMQINKFHFFIVIVDAVKLVVVKQNASAY